MDRVCYDVGIHHNKAEKKSIMDWCISCRFEKIKITGGEGYRVREGGDKPSLSACLQCLYDAVRDVKVTKPSNWRNGIEEDVK